MLALLVCVRRLSWGEVWLVLEAVAALAASRLALSVMPFQQAMACLGLRRHQERDGRDDDGAPAPPHVPSTLEAVRRAVRRAVKIVPFHAVCLQQAVAASIMLRRRGLQTEVHFGVAKDGGRISAHAWSVCRGTVLTGGGAIADHVRIAVYGG